MSLELWHQQFHDRQAEYRALLNSEATELSQAAAQ
jgi:hypothetical protein